MAITLRSSHAFRRTARTNTLQIARRRPTVRHHYHRRYAGVRGQPKGTHARNVRNAYAKVAAVRKKRVYTHPRKKPVYSHPRKKPVYTKPRKKPVFTHPRKKPVYTHPRKKPVFTHPRKKPVYTKPRKKPVYTHPRKKRTSAPAAQVISSSSYITMFS